MSLHIFLNTKLRLNMYFLDITHLLKIELELHIVSRSVYNNQMANWVTQSTPQSSCLYPNLHDCSITSYTKGN